MKGNSNSLQASWEEGLEGGGGSRGKSHYCTDTLELSDIFTLEAAAFLVLKIADQTIEPGKSVLTLNSAASVRGHCREAAKTQVWKQEGLNPIWQSVVEGQELSQHRHLPHPTGMGLAHRHPPCSNGWMDQAGGAPGICAQGLGPLA